MSEVLKTERLVLRPQAARDADAIVAGLSNFEVAKWLPLVPYPYTPAGAAEWLAQLPDAPHAGKAIFTIELPGTGMIGTVSIAAELGYWLAQPHWGRGYMTEAAQALLRWYFAQPECADEVLSSADADNAGSRSVQRKLGFVETIRETRFSKSLNAQYEWVGTALTRAAFEERFR
ncbi:N-acetyltransferase [Youhaiella tibetensis]|uniref:GNAT family N-acetyltransferase n=1 Tax=Paradevosia tibetensis TaxID=1447062 RepID=A0A5B9DUX2_9HYPH|nr:GNAT family N-acetyltransferase [Youhaiella tibetensis]QEE22248.1 GNAT family N-acetyltransferase [Youhaiella tibetensis]GGF43926.1 N-acetyltransferase [Youhaiella tibetensis]